MKILTWGIYLIIFSLPLYLIRFEIFKVPTNILEILIGILFLIWIICGGVKRFFKNFKKFKPIILPVILIFIGVSLATIFSSDLKTSAGIWKGWFMVPLVFFVILITTFNKLKQVKKALFSLFLSSGTVALISLIYLILGKLNPDERLQTFYNSPNYLAMYLATGFIIGFWFLLSSFVRSFKVKYIIIFLFIALLFALFFTKSYGAWIGILIAISIPLLIKLFKTNKKIAWLVLVFIVILLVIIGIFSVTYKSSSLGARLIIWEKSIDIYIKNPILGIGPGTFKNYFPPYPKWGVPQPHNIFLAFLLQTGIIGFIGFIWLLFAIFKKTLKPPITDYPPATASLALRAGELQVTRPPRQVWRCGQASYGLLVYILIHGLLDTTYWKNDLSIIFWLIIALCYITSHLFYLQRKYNLPKEQEKV